MKKESKNRWSAILSLILLIVVFLLGFYLGPPKAFGAIPYNLKIKELKKSLTEAGITGQEIGAAFEEAIIDKTIYAFKRKEYWLYKPESVERGRVFRNQHHDLLTQVEKQFNVEKDLIVSIHAIETKFMDRLGDHRALDALVTRFLYEKIKTRWLKDEIISWFIFCRKTNTSLFVPSSDWGASGPMQLMPFTALTYAIPAGPWPYSHFSMADAFVSAANCLRQNGWKMKHSLHQPVSKSHLLYKVYNHCETYVYAVKKYTKLISQS